MVRRVGRSRGCKTCRERKIKCDEGTPECFQCVRVGRKCPGRIEDLFLIDMSAQARRRVHSEKAASSSSPAASGERSEALGPSRPVDQHAITPNRLQEGLQMYPVVLLQEAENPAAERRFQEAVLCFRAQYHIPTGYRFLQTREAEQTFLTHLLRTGNGSNGLWKLLLPEFSESPVLKYATRAGTMAFYGKLAGDRAIQMEACRWYAKAISTQRVQIERGTNLRDPALADGSAMLAPLMLALFETVMCSTPEAWMQHVEAAAKFLQLVGPEACRSGCLHVIFKSIRLSAIFTSMTTEKPSFLASGPWCNTPFQTYDKAPFDRLVDFLLLVPHLLTIRNRWTAAMARDPRAAEAFRQDLQARTQTLHGKVSQWWALYRKEVAGEYDHDWFVSAPRLPGDELPAGSVTEIPGPTPFASTESAMVISFFDTANILLYKILYLTTRQFEKYDEMTKLHSASIIASAEYHCQHGPTSGGTFTMIFPLKCVCLSTPSREQRRRATRILEDWGQARGVDGICKFAAPQITG